MKYGTMLTKQIEIHLIRLRYVNEIQFTKYVGDPDSPVSMIGDCRC